MVAPVADGAPASGTTAHNGKVHDFTPPLEALSCPKKGKGGKKGKGSKRLAWLAQGGW